MIKSSGLADVTKAINQQFQDSHFVDLKFVENLQMEQEYAQILFNILDVDIDGFMKDQKIKVKI